MTVASVSRAKVAPKAEKVRLDWPDAAKGFGILLVVAGHVIGGLIDSQMPLGPLPLREIFLAIYIFHMPLFFLLSGLFVAQRITSDRTKFILGIERKIYVPYLIWSFVQFNVIYASGSMTNVPPGPYISTVLQIPIQPLSQFWFLIVLAIMHLVTLVLLPRLGKVGIVLLAVVLRCLSEAFQPHNILVQGGSNFYIFYALGMAMAPSGIEAAIREHRTLTRDVVTMVLSVLLLLVMTKVLIDQTGLATFYQENPRLPAPLVANVAWSLLSTGAALAMTASVVLLADRSTGRFKAGLIYLGQRSMPIYILHIMFASGTRIVLVKLLHVSGVTMLLPVLLISGVVGPLIAFAVLERLRLARPLGLA